MTWTDKAHRAGIYIAVALGFFLPISTSLADIFGGAIVVFWLVAGHYKTVVHQVRSNPLVQASLLMFLVLAAGMLYSPESLKVAAKSLKKYREFLFLVFMIPFFREEKHREWAQMAFGAGMVLAILVSFFKFFNPPPGLDLALREGESFKDPIIHGFLLAVLSYGLMAHILFGNLNQKVRWGLGSLCFVATINLFLVVNGRTGWVLFILLGILLVIQRFKWKGVVLGILLFGCLHLGLSVLSKTYSQQMKAVHSKGIEYLETGSTESSMGKRLDYLVNSWQLWKQRPVFGHGTGSFEGRYADLVDSLGKSHKTANPHNEYMMIAVQTGLLGLSVLLYFMFCQVKYAFRLSPLNRNLALGLALMTTAGCMGNSFFLDHTEGMLIIYFTAILFAPLTSFEPRKNA